MEKAQTEFYLPCRDIMLRLRQAHKADCRLLWEWANDPNVRASAFSSEPIPWEGHVKWFYQKLKDQKCLIFIALNACNTPVGQVRFDTTDQKEAKIDVSIQPQSRGSGYGQQMLRLAIEKLVALSPIRTIHAFIKPDNKASIGAFEKTGFKNTGPDTVKGHPALHYQYTVSR